MTAMPRPSRFDASEAAARMIPHDTTWVREHYPQLSWMWDAVDDLTDAQEAADDELSDMEDERDGLITFLEEISEQIGDIVSEYDMSESVQKLLEKIAEDIDKRTDQ